MSQRAGMRSLNRPAMVAVTNWAPLMMASVNVEAALWLSVAPARLDEVGRTLATHPEIPFAAATTGPTNLLASALFRDTRHLYEYLTGRWPTCPG